VLVRLRQQPVTVHGVRMAAFFEGQACKNRTWFP
jgi:hypothetical protein